MYFTYCLSLCHLFLPHALKVGLLSPSTTQLKCTRAICLNTLYKYTYMTTLLYTNYITLTILKSRKTINETKIEKCKLLLYI